MAKRSVLDEIHLAALSAAIELIKNPEYSRDWLKTEFADREINSVRVTNDILDAVEVTMVNQLDQIAAVLKLQLKAVIERADAEDDYESPTMKLVKNILDHSQDPDDTLQLETAEIKPELDGADIEIVDFIGLAHDENKASPSVGGYPAGSKIARAEQAAKAIAEQEFFDNVHAKSRDFYVRAIATIIDRERAKGNEVSEDEARAILQKRLTDDASETD